MSTEQRGDTPIHSLHPFPLLDFRQNHNASHIRDLEFSNNHIRKGKNVQDQYK